MIIDNDSSTVSLSGSTDSGTVCDQTVATTPCPECGRDMPMVTWTGPKPLCHRCQRMKAMEQDTYGEQCLHEALERSLPPNQRGGAHMLACNCPRCSLHC